MYSTIRHSFIHYFVHSFNSFILCAYCMSENTDSKMQQNRTPALKKDTGQAVLKWEQHCSPLPTQVIFKAVTFTKG